MAVGIIIHVTVGKEKRTEFFSEDTIRLGSNETSNLQIHTKKVSEKGVWLELVHENGVYRVINFQKSLNMTLNGVPLQRFSVLDDSDVIEIPETDISFSFFSLTSKSSLITTNREQRHIAQFIEEAALESSVSPRRDEAKAFMREFFRELSREISLTTKIGVLVLGIGFLTGILYLGYAVYSELKESRHQAEQQNETIRQLEAKISQTSEKIGQQDETIKKAFDIISLAPQIRNNYINGICLIVGVYDLVDRNNGKTLRYPDPQAFQPDPYEPTPMEEQVPETPVQMGLTTEGSGTPIEYDFIGTGFHVGSGYILTNRHVVQPWEEDELVKQMMRDSGGRPRIKKLVVYFPNFPQPFPLKIRSLDSREDLAVTSIEPNYVTTDMPVLPLETNPQSDQVGKPVVSMGFPNGPDRFLAMVDNDEARALNSRCDGSRQCIINVLSQQKKIVPLTTQGTITDLDNRRIVHDAKTAEGGSGAPLFGQTGRVIGVNFGVFTENTAANMAVPIRFAVDLLKRVGWKSPEELQAESNKQMASNPQSNSATGPAKP